MREDKDPWGSPQVGGEGRSVNCKINNYFKKPKKEDKGQNKKKKIERKK